MLNWGRTSCRKPPKLIRSWRRSALGAHRLRRSGLANLALYQGRFREAIQILEKGAAADLAAKNPDAAADKFVMLAYAKLLRGDKQSALAAAAERAGQQSICKNSIPGRANFR